MENKSDERFKKLPFSELGRMTNAAYLYGLEAEQKFDSLSEEKKAEILELSIKDTSDRVYKSNHSLKDIYSYVDKISRLLGMENAIDSFSTTNKRGKLLGYDHIWYLCYMWLLKRVPGGINPFVSMFDFALLDRQKNIMERRNDLQSIFNSATVEERTNFLHYVAEIEMKLSERNYSSLRGIIMPFEKEYGLKESLYSPIFSDPKKEGDQMTGIFNAIVCSISCLDFESNKK